MGIARGPVKGCFCGMPFSACGLFFYILRDIQKHTRMPPCDSSAICAYVFNVMDSHLCDLPFSSIVGDALFPKEEDKGGALFVWQACPCICGHARLLHSFDDDDDDEGDGAAGMVVGTVFAFLFLCTAVAFAYWYCALVATTIAPPPPSESKA